MTSCRRVVPGLWRTAVLPVVLAVAGGVSPGCLWVKTEPVEVKPIHITVDVNVRVQRELDDFFGDLDSADPTLK